MPNRQPRRNRRYHDVEIVAEPSTPTEKIVITAPPLDPVTCADCGMVLPQAMAYAVVKHVGGVATDVAAACSQTCAETIRDKWLDKGEPAPEQHDSDATTPASAEPESAAEPEETPAPSGIELPVNDVPTQLVNTAIIELQPMVKAGNLAAQEWLGKIEGAASEGVNRQLYLLGEMKLRLLADPRPDARYVYSVLFQ